MLRVFCGSSFHALFFTGTSTTGTGLVSVVTVERTGTWSTELACSLKFSSVARKKDLMLSGGTWYWYYYY